MTKYEGMLIARQDLGQSQVNDIVASLSEAIKKEGGEVVSVDNWGLKNLAYRIKKNRKGYYVVLNISAPANAIFEYERLARLNEDIIRSKLKNSAAKKKKKPLKNRLKIRSME